MTGSPQERLRGRSRLLLLKRGGLRGSAILRGVAVPQMRDSSVGEPD